MINFKHPDIIIREIRGAIGAYDLISKKILITAHGITDIETSVECDIRATNKIEVVNPFNTIIHCLTHEGIHAFLDQWLGEKITTQYDYVIDKLCVQYGYNFIIELGI